MASKAENHTKKCSHLHCTNEAIKANVCGRHSAPIKRCSEPTCNNIPVKGGVSQRHGAKKKKCGYSSCTNICQKWGGFCRRCVNNRTKNRSQPTVSSEITNQFGLSQRNGANRNYIVSAKQQSISLHETPKLTLQD